MGTVALLHFHPSELLLPHSHQAPPYFKPDKESSYRERQSSKRCNFICAIRQYRIFYMLHQTEPRDSPEPLL